jgi:hypothetical protein
VLRSLKKVVRPVKFGLLDPHGGACLDGLHSKRPLGKFSIEAQGKVTAFRLCGIEEIQGVVTRYAHISRSHTLDVFHLLDSFICCSTSIACSKGINDSRDLMKYLLHNFKTTEACR